jgi:hypothetical protein
VHEISLRDALVGFGRRLCGENHFLRLSKITASDTTTKASATQRRPLPIFALSAHNAFAVRFFLKRAQRIRCALFPQARTTHSLCAFTSSI